MGGAMKLTLTLDSNHYAVDMSSPYCLAIPVEFNGAQPNHFGVDIAKERPIKEGEFIGDTSQGGSCNVSQITFVPHCNGTHTESVGHIVNEKVPVSDAIVSGLMPSVLISVRPEKATAISENYRPALADSDRVITKSSLAQLLDGFREEQLTGLIIRTESDQDKKQTARYGENFDPPFMTIDAIDYLVSRGVRHLVVDFPSVDKMYDDGLLTVHHRFWHIEETTHKLNDMAQTQKTITEMVYVPNEIDDGFYLLDLQVPAFKSDAAPSKPILYKLEKL